MCVCFHEIHTTLPYYPHAAEYKKTSNSHYPIEISDIPLNYSTTYTIKVVPRDPLSRNENQ